jgi:hypothetical protein
MRAEVKKINKYIFQQIFSNIQEISKTHWLWMDKTQEKTLKSHKEAEILQFFDFQVEFSENFDV